MTVEGKPASTEGLSFSTTVGSYSFLQPCRTAGPHEGCHLLQQGSLNEILSSPCMPTIVHWPSLKLSYHCEKAHFDCFFEALSNLVYIPKPGLAWHVVAAQIFVGES